MLSSCLHHQVFGLSCKNCKHSTSHTFENILSQVSNFLLVVKLSFSHISHHLIEYYFYLQKSAMKTDSEFLSEKSLFVPELVRISPVPASLWREIQMLPFALERISNTAKLVNFRETLMAETSLGRFTEQKFEEDMFLHLVILF